jgi:hypothetical protein
MEIDLIRATFVMVCALLFVAAGMLLAIFFSGERGRSAPEQPVHLVEVKHLDVLVRALTGANAAGPSFPGLVASQAGRRRAPLGDGGRRPTGALEEGHTRADAPVSAQRPLPRLGCEEADEERTIIQARAQAFPQAETRIETTLLSEAEPRRAS